MKIKKIIGLVLTVLALLFELVVLAIAIYTLYLMWNFKVVI